jgi:hypothetical protein
LSRDDRIEELLRELDDVEWDALTLNETMRTTKEKFWVTTGGHVFMASGYDLHTRGVAILLNKKVDNKHKQVSPYKRTNCNSRHKT